MGFLAGKKLLITGLLSNRSIAYGVAKACHAQGAELAFSYVGERFKARICEFAAEFDSTLVFDCDVGSDEQIDQMFKDLSVHWPTFDGFVHSIGFAPREAISGDFLEGLSREAFKIAHDISAYSFPGMAKAAKPYLNDKAALLTLTYLGAVRTIPHYNTMGLAKASLEASVRYLAANLGRKGIRVNGIAPGVVDTPMWATVDALFAKYEGLAIGEKKRAVGKAVPMGRMGRPDDYRGAAVFLASPEAGWLTGQIVLAGGARPLVPKIPGLDGVDFLTSDSVWELRVLPRRLVVLGGGPIGSKFLSNGTSYSPTITWSTYGRLESRSASEAQCGPHKTTFLPRNLTCR